MNTKKQKALIKSSAQMTVRHRVSIFCHLHNLWEWVYVYRYLSTVFVHFIHLMFSLLHYLLVYLRASSVLSLITAGPPIPAEVRACKLKSYSTCSSRSLTTYSVRELFSSISSESGISSCNDVKFKM